MKLIIDILEEKVSAAMAVASGQKGCAAIVRPSTDPKFGDYQANGVMALAKQLKTNPKKLAEDVVKNLNVSDICESPGIAGPGFINLRLKSGFIEKTVIEIYNHYEVEEYPGGVCRPLPRFGIDKVENPKTIVVDFSGPNIAKEMHVGHLRSTIIGDCICNLLYFLRHKVVKQNHIGDWGTQFGMLCALYNRKRKKAIKNGVEETFPYLSLTSLEAFYKEAKILFDTDEKFAQEAREAIAGLHSGDQIWMSRWREIVRASAKHYQEIYDKLGITLDANSDRGESFYRDMLADIVIELKDKGLAVESEGAVCVFPVDSTGSPQAGFKNKEGEPLPFIIQKSDGAYLYATTDLAALKYRVEKLEADKIIYVTDARQKLHFEMLFAVARMAGWAKDKTELIHVTFGSVLGENGKPLKTREGENVKLKELLDEAVERARKIVDEKNLGPDLKDAERVKIARSVGIGAVKYADFSNNRTSDYVFSFDKMLAMDGNTAPYMQYAYARVQSIKQKGRDRKIDVDKEIAGLKAISLTELAELDLGKQLIRYGEAIQDSIADYRPNYLTAYLYELAQKFSVFYTECPVLDAEPDKRPTRLLLCDLTAKTIKHGLSELLGIEVVEQM